MAQRVHRLDDVAVRIIGVRGGIAETVLNRFLVGGQRVGVVDEVAAGVMEKGPPENLSPVFPAPNQYNAATDLGIVLSLQ